MPLSPILLFTLLFPNIAYAYGVGNLVNFDNPLIAIGTILFCLLIIGYGINFAIKKPIQAFIVTFTIAGSLLVTYGYVFLVLEFTEEGWLRIGGLILALPIMFKTLSITQNICSTIFPASSKELNEAD